MIISKQCPVLAYFIFLCCFKLLESYETNRSDFADCPKSKIDYNVTLSEGRAAGTFLRANKSIHTMKRCLKHCCQLKGCDVAYFNNGACFSVHCKTIDSCVPTMNKDKRNLVAISFVAKPKISFSPVSTDSNVEREITDNFIAEVAEKTPSFAINDEDVTNPQQIETERWRETKDITVAICCGFVATIMGVGGVVVMTRKLVEEDDDGGYLPRSFEGKDCNVSSLIEKNISQVEFFKIVQLNDVDEFSAKTENSG